MSTEFLISASILSMVSAGIIYAILRPLSLRRAPSRWMVTPEDLGGYTALGLVVSSALGLYLQLLLIRWISSEIRIFAYFKNFVLIACFLGFGLGCYLSKRAISVILLCVPVIFFSAAIALPFQPLRKVIAALPLLLGASSEVFIWSSGTTSVTGSAFTGLLMAALIALPLFVLIAITFVPVGQFVGWYLESARNGISAYTINVIASLAGIALFTALSFLSQPPAVWLAVAGLLSAILFWQRPVARWTALGSFLVAAALLSFQDSGGGKVYWSPYQKLSIRPNVVNGETVAYSLETNGSWYQNVLNLSPEFIGKHPAMFGNVPADLNAYNIPYKFVPQPGKVLVLGAGMGNDVAAALRNGSKLVTAVEIDSLILKLGTQFHPERPYDDGRVKVVVDDARSYLQNSSEKYDLIVFSLLDSHTTASHFTNIRIDNYVYTREALAAAKRLLAPGGVFIVKFQVERRPWIAGRLHDLIAETFGQEPLQLEAVAGSLSWGRFFVTGAPERITGALEDQRFLAYVRERNRLPMEHVTLTTDDWPYFYQREPGLPASVVVISLLLVAISLLGAHRIGLGVGSIRWEFFLLGAGFMLLEAQIISRMALLFGTTWVVNSIVIATLLLLIVAANGVAAAFPRLNLNVVYMLVALTLAMNYLIPVQALFYKSFIARATVASLVLCLPVFFAGIVFVRRFATAGFAAAAIGSNLLGALAGGITESLSLWVGFRAIVGVAAALYLGAWFCFRRDADAPPGAPLIIAE